MNEAPVRIRAPLWLALALAPLAWFMDLSASYALAGSACERGHIWPLHAVTMAALGLTALSIVLAHREWRHLGRPRSAHQPGHRGAAQFLALAALGLAIFFTLITAAAAVPAFVLAGRCS